MKPKTAQPTAPLTAHLASDLAVLQGQRNARRRLMAYLAGGALTAYVGGGRAVAAVTSSCTAAPEETNGPFPADGAPSPFGKTVNILTRSGIVRRDITRSFGTSSTVAGGVPLRLTVSLEAAQQGCQRLPGHAVYLWHCDRRGDYSLYAPRIANENYLRGVQVSDQAGQVTFDTIFPACYMGRYPHIHFEVYPSLAAASSEARALVTSQLALPRETCAAIYRAAEGYHESERNLAGRSAADDMVFRDLSAVQLAALTPAMTGSLQTGFEAAASIAVRAT
jgi:protocatechuate 3,4-dioxygenase beta subunit